MFARSILAALAACLLSGPAWAQDRAVAVTFDDLPYQAADAELCDPARAMALTETFVGMLRPLDTRAAVFVNESKVCEARRATLLPALLDVWLDAGLDLGNHTATHINIHRNTVEAYLADVDAGAPVSRAVLAARGRELRFFRHPFLFTGETPEKKTAIAAGLAERGYVVAPVTIDNNDWMFAALYRDAEAAGDEALKTRIGEAYVAHMAAVLDHWEPYSVELSGGREPAQVLLLHANTLNRDRYPQIHALYLSRGYRFVTLDEALTDPVYAHADEYVRANGVSWLHRWTFSEGRPIRWEPEPPKWIVDAYETRD
ncbi:MAG TPA: polysaccharide deacetylase family protein [Brevundimonas sp.]